ncbi:glycine--tRNA ligase subunit beta [uncultured Campylobacter sp.]|uniref:glycine--tRNA ligase subunit beta n=1 Tax=uncultured Campylobacter sp. TaxID=218934 RepID=UPI002616DEF8|nr:glycine--tRNA ligase subunit beta [uncultured Campylobacter sp.]
MNGSLLIEILVEELPAIPLLKELDNIPKKWNKILEEYKLKSNFNFFYTPRRLVLYHDNFAKKQEKQKLEFIGAPKDLAFKDGILTKAGLSFLQKAGISEDELSFKLVKGKEVLYYQKEVEGQYSKNLLEEMISNFLDSLSFGKSMRWGKGDFHFIRPIRNLLCILDDELVDICCYGIRSAKRTFVHRTVSYEAFHIDGVNDYFNLLEKNFVILNQEKRREKILNDFKELEQKHNIKIKEDKDLLDEVVAITEYPNALLGSFEEDFLILPSEVIIDSMRENQRYFSVFKNGAFTNNFVFVSNAVCEDYSQIINGNERVLRARLSDAVFFYENDLKSGLCVEKLKIISYFEGLGTIYDKVQREKEIAKVLCKIYAGLDEKDILDAIEYSKSDLATQMVYEFTSLQGVIGYHYAKKQGFKDEICLAILEQYMPKSEKDSLPSTKFTSIVALSNKLDTLMCLFSINQIPSGTKDPYALRRAALGVLKILINLGASFRLDELLKNISFLYKDFDIKILLNFILERLYSLYDANASFIKASLRTYDIVHIDSSIKALLKLSSDKDFFSYFDTFKRLSNIIKDSESRVLDEKLLKEKEEKDLFNAFKACDLTLPSYELLRSLFALKPQIDTFFDKIMINVDDEKIKNNRLALIQSIYNAFLTVADIKEISL